MKTKRLICALLLAALMLSLGVNASAAKKASIKFPAKMGLVLEGKPPIHIVDRALGY